MVSVDAQGFGEEIIAADPTFVPEGEVRCDRALPVLPRCLPGGAALNLLLSPPPWECLMFGGRRTAR